MGTKKTILNQNYENYWKLTLEYSDIYGVKYNRTLKIIVDFIDNNYVTTFNFSSKYKELQEKLDKVYPKKDMASVRKSINQFVKLGFIKYQLSGYHKKVKKFLNETNKERKRRIFSEIVYSSASFNSSITEESQEKEVNFFIKTLEVNHSLNKDEIMGLVLTTPSAYVKGYLNKQELEESVRFSQSIGFDERKYNQLRFISEVFGKLEGICYDGEKFYLETDSSVEDAQIVTTKKRDNYLQRLYKNQLKQESKELFGDVVCMISKVPYYAMIASHIKPFVDSLAQEEYDPQNGLLLGKDLDFMFDQGYISVADDGKIILCDGIKSKIVEYHRLENLYIDTRLLTPERREYLNYHRNYIFKN